MSVSKKLLTLIIASQFCLSTTACTHQPVNQAYQSLHHVELSVEQTLDNLGFHIEGRPSNGTLRSISHQQVNYIAQAMTQSQSVTLGQFITRLNQIINIQDQQGVVHELTQEQLIAGFNKILDQAYEKSENKAYRPFLYAFYKDQIPPRFQPISEKTTLDPLQVAVLSNIIASIPSDGDFQIQDALIPFEAVSILIYALGFGTVTMLLVGRTGLAAFFAAMAIFVGIFTIDFDSLLFPKDKEKSNG